MDLKFTPEQVDQMVRETIMKSGIGKTIEAAIVKALTPGWDSPVDKAVKDFVAVQLAEMLRQPEWKDQIDAAIRAALLSRISAETLQEIAGAAINRIENAARSRD